MLKYSFNQSSDEIFKKLHLFDEVQRIGRIAKIGLNLKRAENILQGLASKTFKIQHTLFIKLHYQSQLANQLVPKFGT